MVVAPRMSRARFQDRWLPRVISLRQEIYQQAADMTQSTAVIEVDTTIDKGRWTSFQTATVLICGGVTIIDGCDAQSIGFVAPVLAKQWGLAPAAFGPV